MTNLAEGLKSIFIVIDGPEGAGKTTQKKLTAQWLREQGVELVEAKDPGGTTIGEAIRAVLLDAIHEEMAPETETLLCMASRTQLAEEVICPALLMDKCVLCDRWISASLAYQGAGGIRPDDINRIADSIMGDLVRPKLTILLDLPVEAGLGRKTTALDRIESKSLDYHRRVRELFREQAAQDPDRFVQIDGSGSVEQVQREIQKVICSIGSNQSQAYVENQ